MRKAPPERGEGHFSTQTVKKKRQQLQKAGRAIYWRKQKGTCVQDNSK
jgi:hypothetical protein